MSRSLRRGALAATALAFSLASLAGCAAGKDAATLDINPDTPETSVGDIKLQNVNVVTQPEGSEGPAVVLGMIFNNGQSAQTLESISLPQAGSDAKVKLSPASGSGDVTVPAGGWVQLGGKGNASAVLEKGAGAAKPGDAEKVVFDFSRTGEVQITAFVWPAEGYLRDSGPSNLPAEPASPTASPSEGPAGEEGHGAGEEGAENGDAEEHGADAGASASSSASASETAASEDGHTDGH